MYAKLKSGNVVSGKAADVLIKIGIATECEAPANKPKKENVAKVKAPTNKPKTKKK